MSDIDDCLKSVERLTRDREEVMRASDDRIAEIRARHDAVHNVLRGASQMHADRGYLLAEVEKLTRERDEARAEVERLREEMPVAESLRVDAKCAEIERDEARAVVWNQAKENADLRAEVEQLTREISEARAEVARQAAEIWTLMRAWRSDDEARAYIQARRRREAKP